MRRGCEEDKGNGKEGKENEGKRGGKGNYRRAKLRAVVKVFISLCCVCSDFFHFWRLCYNYKL